MVEGMKWMDYPLSEDTFLSSIREYTLATWWEELSHLKRPWCWERLRAGGEGDDRGWDGWMASPTQWTWVRVDSRSWWWTGRPGVLWFLESQRVGNDWATELDWTGAPHLHPLLSSTPASDRSASHNTNVFLLHKTNIISFFPESHLPLGASGPSCSLVFLSETEGGFLPRIWAPVVGNELAGR